MSKTRELLSLCNCTCLLVYDFVMQCLILPQDAKPLKDFSFRIHKGQQKGDLECLHQSRENGLVSNPRFS